MNVGIDIGGTSIKVARREGSDWTFGRSPRHERPSIEDLRRTIGRLTREGDEIGLCVPGPVEGMTVVRCRNVPALDGIEVGSLGNVRALTTDVHAAALDVASRFDLGGRFVLLSIGTGVGGCVMQDGHLVTPPGRTGGFGAIDIDGEPLEDLVGLKAWRGTPDPGTVDGRDRRIVALRRAIERIHAHHDPEVVVLTGGVGVRLARFESILRQGGNVRFGIDDHHGARGALRNAQSSDVRPKS